LITDLGFIVYWVSAASNLIPSAWLYEDGDNPILVAWNWSFAPVDLAASVLGLTSLVLARRVLGPGLWWPCFSGERSSIAAQPALIGQKCG